MMLGLLFGIVGAVQDDGPLARNARFMASAQGLTLEFTASSNIMEGSGKGSLVLRLPDKQSYTCTWGAEKFRYTHSKAGALSIRDDTREYLESEAYARNVQPSGEDSGVGPEMAYPGFILYGALEHFDPKAKRDVLGKETVLGLSCDKLRVVSTERGTAGTHTFWIDDQGRVRRWARSLETANGQLNITLEFPKVEPTAPSTESFYAPKLPIGYMPMRIPGPKSRVRMVSEPAYFGSWIDARSGATVDVAKLAKDTYVAIVFTDPDCPICAKIEPYLTSLRRALKPKGAALIEVSLGTKSPDVSKKDKDRRVFWDKSGDIEHRYGTPGTPYFLIADKSGTLVRGWQGYDKSMEADITKNLLSAFDED